MKIIYKTIDLGNVRRGQGKRFGKHIMGAMSDFKGGLKLVPDWEATFCLDEEQAFEVELLYDMFPRIEFLRYYRARDQGLDHDSAMEKAWEESDVSR